MRLLVVRGRDPVEVLAEAIYDFALVGYRRHWHERPAVQVAGDYSERDVVDLLAEVFDVDEADVLRALGRLQSEGLLVRGNSEQ